MVNRTECRTRIITATEQVLRFNARLPSLKPCRDVITSRAHVYIPANTEGGSRYVHTTYHSALAIYELAVPQNADRQQYRRELDRRLMSDTTSTDSAATQTPTDTVPQDLRSACT